MLKNEINEKLNIHTDEDSIANVITKSLIRYYSVNGYHYDQFQDNYLNYLRMIFSGRRFHFLDKEKLLSCKDQSLSTVMVAVREDLTGKTGTEELTCLVCGNQKHWKLLWLSFLITSSFLTLSATDALRSSHPHA